MELTFIDLFSGCGGMSLGFEMAGFRNVIAIDNWEDALATYSFNRQNAKTLCADLKFLTPEEVEGRIGNEKIDVIIGGPPCQGFSIAGKRIIEDDRNKLYKSFVAMVRHFRPQAFVMENVPNILSIGEGIIAEGILKDFESLGYNVSYKVLLSSDYGVPQNRRRAVFVGLESGKYNFPDKTCIKPVTSSEALSDLPEFSVEDGSQYQSSPASQFQEYARKGSMGIYNHDITIHTEQTKSIIAQVPDGGNYKDLPRELWDTRKVNIAWTRLNSQKPSFTIDCGHNHHFHYRFNRVPTVRESARLQSFPDSFIFTGNKGSQLKQVGNAVPPLMAYEIAVSLTQQLKNSMYNPDIQYRCTIIRGKSQTEMEDLLPFYAQTVHQNCPCTRSEFDHRCNNKVSEYFYGIGDYEALHEQNRKTVRNHITEIMGELLGLYYLNDEGYICESSNCRHLNEHQDFPTFFKSLCLNLQFPNAAVWTKYMLEHMSNGINIRPLCYVISLLEHARRNGNHLLTKQEIGYYVLNSLEVLQGKVPVEEVFEKIMSDRKNKVRKPKLSGSRDWQHIKEMFNLLNLANLCLSDKDYIWLNPEEDKAISIFLDYGQFPSFNIYRYAVNDKEELERLKLDWQAYYSSMHPAIAALETQFRGNEEEEKEEKESTAVPVRQKGVVGMTTVEIGDQGEALVYRMEKERVSRFKERLANKVLLLGKTKGLGYDISSIEADENHEHPEFARYIEVKTTTRVTKPSFDQKWMDSINLTAKEWIAAQQYREYYNIYRVYLTREEAIVLRIQNPFQKNEEGIIDTFPTIYQMDFDNTAITDRYILQRTV